MLINANHVRWFIPMTIMREVHRPPPDTHGSIWPRRTHTHTHKRSVMNSHKESFLNMSHDLKDFCYFLSGILFLVWYTLSSQNANKPVLFWNTVTLLFCICICLFRNCMLCEPFCYAHT